MILWTAIPLYKNESLELICLIMQQKQVSKILVNSSFALKSNLASLKTKVDKLDIDKLVPVTVDTS